MNSYKFINSVANFKAELQKYDSIKDLLKTRGTDGLTVLHYIFTIPEKNIINYVLQECSVDFLNSIQSESCVISSKYSKFPMPAGRNILHFAIQFCDDNTIEQLRSIGIEDKPDEFGFYPIHLVQKRKRKKLPSDKEMCTLIEKNLKERDEAYYASIKSLIRDDVELSEQIINILNSNDDLVTICEKGKKFEHMMIKNMFPNNVGITSEKLFNSILNKTEVYKLKPANSMSKYGFNCKFTPFESIVKYFVNFCNENQLHKQMKFENCDYNNYNAFVIGYQSDKPRKLNWHRDDSCWSFSVCLHNSSASSELEIEYLDVHGDPMNEIIQINEGEAILFPGSKLHRACNSFNVDQGSRINIVIWFKNAD